LRSLPNLKYCPGICVAVLGTGGKAGYKIRTAEQDPKLGPSKHKAELLSILM